ncbi:hypothetical protein CEXT_493851 [Caerostris extrusa]|uniref:Uncharacterized protein n=1 Tax=Caerostris extrusa TaxID=172846 RepID=A0AAV4N0K7_CAEEX|nr:hypothetical protein CEXT_493851 [Caerostris extrusa]
MNVGKVRPEAFPSDAMGMASAVVTEHNKSLVKIESDTAGLKAVGYDPPYRAGGCLASFDPNCLSFS